MRILYLTNIPSPYRVDFFNELGTMCDLTVIYERKSAKSRDKKWQEVKSKNFREIFLKGKKIGDDISISLSVIKYLKNEIYDLIVIGGYSTPTAMLAIEYLRLKKINFVLNADGGFIKSENKFIKSIKTHFIKGANYWLSTGRSTSEYLIHYGAKEPNIYIYPFTSIRKRDVIESSIEIEKKRKIREKLGVKEERVIISVGRFIDIKGFDVLINSMKFLSKEYGVYIIGGDPTEEYINLKDNLGLDNLHFEGFKNSSELREYYRMADLFVLPTRRDVWGLVINEAMAQGLPVITTNKCIAGLELIRNKENGYIISSDNSRQIAENINYTFNKNKLISQMSKKSIELIKEYTIENMASRHMEIFESILRSSNE